MTSPDAPSARRARSLLYRRLALIKPYRRRLLLGFAVLLVTVGLQLTYPRVIAFFIDEFLAQLRGEWLFLVLLMVGVLLFEAVATAMHAYIFSSTGSMIVADLRKSLYGAIIRQEIGFFDRRNVGELTNRLSADVEELQAALTINLSILAQSVLTCVGAAVMMVSVSAELSLLVLLIVPPLVLCTRWIGTRVRRESRRRQEELARCGQLALEAFSNIRLVRAFTQGDNERRKYNQATDSALSVSLYCNGLFAGLHASGSFFQGVALLLTLWVGGQLVAAESLSVGGLTSFVIYAVMAAGSVTSMGGLWGEWMRSVGATERVFDLLERRPGQTGSEGRPVARLEGDIEFESVTLRYPTRPGQQALDGFSLRIRAGQKVALVGPSGAGKTSVVSLLLGFYPPSEGIIRFDGSDAAELRRDDLRKQLAIVEQEPALFSGTIMENLRYAVADRQLGDAEVLQAAAEANVDEFVSGFPDGYDTVVGHRGVQLSGGQKQRVAIARALLRRPRILILDEPTSALDAHNESMVRSAFERLMEGRTTIIITHQLSTITHVDTVVLLEAGRIARLGTPEELLGATGDG